MDAAATDATAVGVAGREKSFAFRIPMKIYSREIAIVLDVYVNYKNKISTLFSPVSTCGRCLALARAAAGSLIKIFFVINVHLNIFASSICISVRYCPRKGTSS